MKKLIVLIFLIQFHITLKAQTDSSAQSFFPSHVGDKWYYKYNQTFGYVTTLTRDSIANGKRFLFYNSFSAPQFEIDSLLNVWSDPTTGYRSLRYKLNAEKNDHWHVEGAIMAKVDDEYWDFILNVPTQIKKIGYYSELDTINYSVWFYDHYLAAGFGFYLEITDAMQEAYQWLEGCIITGVQYGRMTGVNNYSAKQRPMEYLLYPIYPNPFNPTTTIRYQLPEKGIVKITINDILGREIAILRDEGQEKGLYTITWNASKYSSGIFFCRLQTKGGVQTRKMILAK